MGFGMPKKAVFTLKLESELRDTFAAEAAATHRAASHLVRTFMREFVQRQREARQHDAWFRAKVQKPSMIRVPEHPMMW